MGRGSPVCQQIREKIIEMFKNNVPQRKIGRDLDILPSTVQNIIKKFKESGGISVRKRQGRKPKLNNRDLRSKCAPDQRRKGSSRLLPATSPKARVCHGMGLCQCPWQR